MPSLVPFFTAAAEDGSSRVRSNATSNCALTGIPVHFSIRFIFAGSFGTASV